MPLVSVLMLFHRDTDFLRPAIASVLAQEFRDFELILVDNGTGLSATQLGESGRDPRLRWVRLARNEGIPAGHNAGAAAARGTYIALHDYDDLSLPQRLGLQVAALQADANLGLVSGLARRIDAAGRELGHEFCLRDPDEHRRYAPYAAPLITPAAMGRRELFAALPYRTEFPFAADLDFQARVVERARTAVVPEILLRYRWHDGQTTQARAAAIEHSRAVIQIITGRRLAGRAEDLAAVQAATVAPTAAGSWRRGAAVCVGDRFPVFAAYQARRSFALDRSPRGAWHAFRWFCAARQLAAGADRARVRRMFFTGPVRALELHPSGP
jgi:hypothetical protein